MTLTACAQRGVRPNFTTQKVRAEAARETSLGRTRSGGGAWTEGSGIVSQGKPQ